MKLSLSGRLVESGGGTIVPLEAFLDVAKRCGYEGVDLRATQLGAAASDAEWDALRAALAERGVGVFETQYGQPIAGDEAERAFSRFARLTAELGGEGIRIGGDLATLKRAARLAASHGVRVLYQMHTGGPFETIASAAAAVAEVGEPNFGVMPEPANLLMAGEAFEEGMFEPLAGRILGVHVQTLEVRADAPDALKLRDGTEVRYARVAYAENRQIDFAAFFAALRAVGFDGYVNELEPCPGAEALEAAAGDAAEFLRPLLA